MTDRRHRLLTILVILSLFLGCFTPCKAAAEEPVRSKRFVVALAYSDLMSQQAVESMRQSALELTATFLASEEGTDCEAALLDSGSGLNWSAFTKDQEDLRFYLGMQRGRSELSLQELLQTAVRHLNEEPEDAEKSLILLVGLRNDYSMNKEILSPYSLTVCTFLEDAAPTLARSAAETLWELSDQYIDAQENSPAAVLYPTEETAEQEPESAQEEGTVNISGPFETVWLYSEHGSLRSKNEMTKNALPGTEGRVTMRENGEYRLSVEAGKGCQLHFTAEEDGTLFFRYISDDTLWSVSVDARKGDDFLAEIAPNSTPRLTREEQSFDMLCQKAEDLRDLVRAISEEAQGETQIQCESLPLYYGSFVVFKAQPHEGYQFEGWYLDDTLFSTETSLRQRVLGELHLEARFSPVTEETEEDAQEPEDVPVEDQQEKREQAPRTYLLYVAAALVLFSGTVAVILLIQRKKLFGKLFGASQRAGMVVMSGSLKGKCFAIPAGKLMIVGTDKEDCQIVFGKDYEYLSRCHMSILFDRASGQYLVTDTSTNGVYLTDRHRLPKGRQVPVEPCTVLLLANSDCTVTLI